MRIVENFELVSFCPFKKLKWLKKWICYYNFEVLFEILIWMRCYWYLGFLWVRMVYWQTTSVEQVSNTGWCCWTAHLGTYATPAQAHARCTLFCCSNRQHIPGFIIVRLHPLFHGNLKLDNLCTCGISCPSLCFNRWVDYARLIGIQKAHEEHKELID